MRRVSRVPLLPTVAGICAVGVISVALGTSQISLNTGGSTTVAPTPTATNTAPAKRSGNSLSGREETRAGRSAHRAAITVAFHTTSRWTTGFQASATVTNHGRQASTMTLTVRYPKTRIVTAWGAKVLQTGPALVVSGSVAPGASLKVSFNAQGSGTAPSTCTVDGATCHPA